MVGIPLFSGFVSKLLFAEAAVLHPTHKMMPTLIVLAVSTILNAIYFLKTVVRIYVPEKRAVEMEKGDSRMTAGQQKQYTVTMVLFIMINLVLGMMSEPILGIIETGLIYFV